MTGDEDFSANAPEKTDSITPVPGLESVNLRADRMDVPDELGTGCERRGNRDLVLV